MTFFSHPRKTENLKRYLIAVCKDFSNLPSDAPEEIYVFDGKTQDAKWFAVAHKTAVISKNLKKKTLKTNFKTRFGKIIK